MNVMSLNILRRKEENLERNQEALDQIYSLVDKAYYVDAINYKIDNTTECSDHPD
jgi:hypothetical protein